MFLFKILLADSTSWAYPVLREVFKGCACRDFVFWVSFCRIVNVSAGNAYISVHNEIVWFEALIQYSDRNTKKRHPRKDAVISDKVRDYFSSFFAAFLASAFFVTSYMIGVAMKIEA